jgi:alkylated DNA repair dioxygenase AlkB
MLNGLLLNWYDARLGHYIGPHSDAFQDLVPQSPIVTISLGETRVFRLSQTRTLEGIRRQVYRFDLRATHGSVIILPWRTNLAWKHAVPRSRRYVARRISITLRAFRD